MRIGDLSLYTFEFDKIEVAIHTNCCVFRHFVDNKVPEGIEEAPEYVALWDTGASMSAISKKVVEELGLIPLNAINVSGANGSFKSNVYAISLILPNNYIETTLVVCECNSSNHDVIIGMDIISKGDFAITNKNGKTKFTFQIPSTHDIDFEKENISKSLDLKEFEEEVAKVKSQLLSDVDGVVEIKTR